jgi:hypothetical protein
MRSAARCSSAVQASTGTDSPPWRFWMKLAMATRPCQRRMILYPRPAVSLKRAPRGENRSASIPLDVAKATHQRMFHASCSQHGRKHFAITIVLEVTLLTWVWQRELQSEHRSRSTPCSAWLHTRKAAHRERQSLASLLSSSSRDTEVRYPLSPLLSTT